MVTGYCKIGNYEFMLKKSVCGYSVIPVANIERPSGQIELFYQHTGATQTLTMDRTRDRGVTQTQTNYTLKDENNVNVVSGLLTMPICSLVFAAALNAYFLIYYYNFKILFVKGTLDISDVITWAQPTIVVSNVTMARPQIIYNTDESLDIYYKVLNESLEEIIKIKRSKDYGITWTDIAYNPVVEIKKENIKIFNLPECSKVGMISHDGQTMNQDFLTHTVDGKLTLIENTEGTSIVPTQTPAVLRSRTDEYYVAYQSGIGLTLTFGISRDTGLTWSKI